MTANLQPAIKWSGSKRLQAPTIARFFPSFSTYYEPFLGGGSILFHVSPVRAICGDVCGPLIEFWKVVKTNPKALIDSYKRNWEKLREQGHTHFYEVRDRFNANQNPFDLLFLSRTCVNGLIRFNADGQFNNSLHHTRKGIEPMKLSRILLSWSIRIKDVEFVQGDYRDTTRTATKRDFIYLDPPYFYTKGRYYGRIDFEDFVEYLQEMDAKGIRFALSFDGSRGNIKFLVEFPRELFKRNFLINNGNSTFRKVMDQRVEKVREALYLNWLESETNLLSYPSRAGLSSLSNSVANVVFSKSSE